MSRPERKMVRFIRNCSPYRSGERAAFNVPDAQKLVDRKVAVFDSFEDKTTDVEEVKRELTAEEQAALDAANGTGDGDDDDDDDKEQENGNASDESNDDNGSSEQGDAGDGDGEDEQPKAKRKRKDKPAKRAKRKRNKLD